MDSSPNENQTIQRIVERALEISDPKEAVEYIEAECARANVDSEKALVWHYTSRRMRETEETVGIGDTVGNYKIVRSIGRGGIARVYLAEHTVISPNLAAIKVFRKSAVTDDGEEVWRADPALLSRFNHDNIVRFYDAGMTEDKTPYVIMEYVEGQHITDFCNANMLTVRKRLELFRALCAVISYVHGKDIAHLDLKPSNILVTSAPEGKLKLIDFGAGKLLSSPHHSTIGRCATWRWWICSSPRG
jgi:serine/threonine protein kinase